MVKEPKIRYKVGDIVKIVNPVFVTRVGYPFTPEMAFAELNTSHTRQLVLDLMHEVGINPYEGYQHGNLMTPSLSKVLETLSFELVRTRNFGGSERSLYFTELPDMKDLYFRIMHMKRTVTGVRVPASGDGEDYEPAYMCNAVHHHLIGLWLPMSDFRAVFKGFPGTWWIQKENVIKDDRV